MTYLSLGSFTVSLGLLDGSLSIDLGDFTLLLSQTLSLTSITQTLSFCDIYPGLIDGTLMGLATQGFKIV